MNYIMRAHAIIFLCATSFCFPFCGQKTPRVTVIFVVDQCAYHVLHKTAPFMRDGIRLLLDHGIVYDNAHYPHAVPATGPGHAGLNTGTFPRYHGIIANKLIMPDGKKVPSDYGDPKKYPVFNDGGFHSYGKSANFIMVDGISDQMVLSSDPCAKRYAISISYKSRAAICTAGHMGKAIWFDEQTGRFTSSKAYFDTIPDWLCDFNNSLNFNVLLPYTWYKAADPLCKRAYCFKNINNYTYASGPRLVGTTISLGTDDAPYELFIKTPLANKVLLDLAQDCIRTYITRRGNEELLLWVCLSSLDKLGHTYGPDSMEVIDYMYHLDKQIGQFMRCIENHLPRRRILYVFTADHGISPFPELLRDQGLTFARRIIEKDLIQEINAHLALTFDRSDLISYFQAPAFFYNATAYSSLTPAKQQSLIEQTKEFLKTKPGIVQVWDARELEKSCAQLPDFESFYKNQLYPGRSGTIIIQPQTYNQITSYNKGTSHRSPYEYDTHVPLVIYQKGNLERQLIYEKVWTLQLANTLAYVLQTPKPSASIFDLLPGIIDEEPIEGWRPILR